MAKNVNSAYRSREIINAVKSNQDKTPVHEVWASVFSIEEPDRHRRNFAISRCLADLHDEVELVRNEMLKLGYSEDLYTPSLNRCNSIFGFWSVSM